MRILTLLLTIFSLNWAAAQDQQYYVKVLRAAPGELLPLIDLLKQDMSRYTELGIAKPYLMRHSQGDQWDLLLIHPIVSAAQYFSNNTMSNSSTMGQGYGDEINDKISFQEEGFFAGPSRAQFDQWMTDYSYYHVEIFTALAGKQAALLREREMENDYLRALDRRPNFIFTRTFGTSWIFLRSDAMPISETMPHQETYLLIRRMQRQKRLVSRASIQSEAISASFYWNTTIPWPGPYALDACLTLII